MKPRITVGMCLVLMIAAAFVTFQITYTSLTNKYESAVYSVSKYTDVNAGFDNIEMIEQENNDWRSFYTSLLEVDGLVRSASYYSSVDQQLLNDEAIRGYVRAMALSNDKYARYYSPDEYEEQKMQNVGKSKGIGIRFVNDAATGGMYVFSIMPDSPAAASPLKEKDVIIGVNGEDTVTVDGINNAVEDIQKAKIGEQIKLSVLTADSEYTRTVEYTMVKADYEIQTVSGKLLEDGIGYIAIYEFNLNTGNEFVDMINKLADSGANSFIFDVRDNPGGIIEGVSDSLDRLLPEGAIVSVKNKAGEEEVIYSDELDLKVPMVVLINGNTASGGELFAAALRDYEKATLIGTKTYGKGSMQTEYSLSSGGCIGFTTHLYYPPSGVNYDGVGIEPHKTVELPEEYSNSVCATLTLEQDIQLQAALDEIKLK